MNTDPLNEEELNFVDETLLKYGNDDSILNVSELDGFLTAIVSGPEAIMPSQWIPVMWGGAGNEPEWETEDEFQRFFSLVMQHMNNNITMLMDYPEKFEALFMHGELDGRTYRITGDWCEGYLKGVQMSPDEWLKLPEPMLKEQLGIMGIFGSDEHIEELDKLSEAGVEALQDKIEPAACALHAYFLRQREKEIPKKAEQKPAPISVLPKVGRNDPCPCGSGKKAKKCCLFATV